MAHKEQQGNKNIKKVAKKTLKEKRREKHEKEKAREWGSSNLISPNPSTLS